MMFKKINKQKKATNVNIKKKKKKKKKTITLITALKIFTRQVYITYIFSIIKNDAVRKHITGINKNVVHANHNLGKLA